MKYFLLFIFLPLFSLAQSKDEMLQGTWVKVKAEMKDGSRIVDHHGCGMDFIKYSFNSDGSATLTNDVLFDGFQTRYKIMGDSLVIGGTIYNLLGLTKDTLKVSFFLMGAEDSQLPLYYFVKAFSGNAIPVATFDPALKDSVYLANNVFFPRCKGSFSEFNHSLQGKYENGSVKASFVIDKKGKVKNFTIIQLDSVSKTFAKSIGNVLGDLSWIPAQKNKQPVNSLVQLTIKTGFKKYGNNNYGMNSMALTYDFLPKAPYPPIDRDEAEAANEYFKNALNQVNSGNNEKAVEFLTKCIEIDNIYLSAYSLRALVYSHLGKSKEACKDWSTLASLGQVSGAKSLAKFCK